MKLLFDENLSPKLPRRLADVYPGSTHVRDCGLRSADDAQIWNYAAQHEYAVIAKDLDFYERSLVRGSPPKLIWLRMGNCSTKRIEVLLRTLVLILQRFDAKPSAPLLILP